MNPRWVRFWRPARRLRAYWFQGLADVTVTGEHHLHEARDQGHGILITPNHPSHADPYVIQEVSDRSGIPFYFMAAWQVFAMTHWMGRIILRQHGCFSVNREGHDLRAFRQAVDVLQSDRPLVMFPEGEVLHLNDQVTPFRRGAATAALRAARRSGRPVACLPTAIKYYYADNPQPRLVGLVERLENRLGLGVRPEMPLVSRVVRTMEALFEAKEIECFGSIQSGSSVERRERLITTQLSRLESHYGVGTTGATVSERVKRLRRQAITLLEGSTNSQTREAAQRDLDDLFAVMQLFSYPVDYLAHHPTLERLAETLDKLEEDVLEVPTARTRGIRRTVIALGAPILAQPYCDQKAEAVRITEALQFSVQELLNSLVGCGQTQDSSFSLPFVDEAQTGAEWIALPAAA